MSVEILNMNRLRTGEDEFSDSFNQSHGLDPHLSSTAFERIHWSVSWLE
jgi:hypothetical protein